MDRRFGRYTVIATLGSGAMGEVLRARDERLGREVALKIVRNLFGMQAEVFARRFEAEARALAALSHPAIVQIHDLGIEDGEPYLVMELVDGPSLKARLADGPMTAAEVRAMGIQLARGLEAAHQRHILHRDLKPANILRSPQGQWKLADFGVARVPESEVTIDGQFLGTPAYAAPEALTLGAFSERSDVFGLAATLVEAVTGQRLRGDADLSALVKRSGEAIVLPAGVPAALAGALLPALARDPARRPTAAGLAELLAAGEVADDGTAVLPPAAPPRRRFPRIAVAAAAAALAVGVVAAIALTRHGGAAPAAAPDATAAAADRLDPAEGPELPPIVPGRVTIVYPRHLDGRAYAAYAEVVDDVRAQQFASALDKLDDYEERFGVLPESRHLRLQLELLPGYQHHTR